MLFTVSTQRAAPVSLLILLVLLSTNALLSSSTVLAQLSSSTVLAQSSPGEVLSFEKIEGLKGPLDTNDLFGSSMRGVGDLDGDGVPDAVVGSPRDDDGGNAQDFDAGAVYILFLNADGSVKREQKISATEGGLSSGTLGQTDRFGSSVVSIGDLDGDGVTDLAVGAIGDRDGGTFSGAVYIIFLNNDGTVKDQQKIGDGSGGVPIFTLDDGDAFGSAIASLGDIDGNGIPDLLVGASGDDSAGTSVGAAYTLFLNTDGTVSNFRKITEGEGGLASGTLGSGFGRDRFGGSATGISDLNSDGVPDAIVGAPGDSDSRGSGRGAIYILYLNRDGSVQAHQKIGGGRRGELSTLDYGDNFGSGVANIGDIDNDGVTDIFVGSPGNGNTATPDRGALYFILLNNDSTVKGFARLNDRNTGISTRQDDNLGISLALLGDLNGDGSLNMLVGSSGFKTDGSPSTDAAYVLGITFTSTSGLDISLQGVINDSSFGPATSGDVPLNAGSRFGRSTTGIGDVDGDGVPDVLVGGGTSYILFLNADGTVDTSQNINLRTVSATGLGDLDGDGVPDALSGGPDISGGQVSILFLNSDGSVKVVQEISRSAGGLLPGTLDSNDAFGSSAARIGDLDGDGITEVVVGAVGDFSDGDTGTAYVLFLNSNGTVKDQLEITDGAGGLATGTLNQRDEFGSSAAGIGDLDADGIPDILIGAAGDDDGGTDAGAVYILFLNADGTVKAQQKISEVEGRLAVGTLQRFEHFGRSASGIGDFDGDGVPDILVGAADRPPGTLRNQTVGAVYALFLDTDGTVRAQQKISATEGGLPSGTLRIGDGFGMSVANIGDLDGNGVPAILAGASGDKIVRPPFEYGYGAAYVLFLDGTPSSNRPSISVNLGVSFGDPRSEASYRLVGLPGLVDQDIAETLSGEQETMWRVFRETGSTSGDPNDYLAAYDGSDAFRFAPGRGFWMLSRDDWTVNTTIDAVFLSADSTTTIPLQDGWNIISNPLAQSVSWNSTLGLAANTGLTETLWQWDGTWREAETFNTAREGEAYYLFNNSGLTELTLQKPELATARETPAAAPVNDAETLHFTATIGSSIDQDPIDLGTVTVGQAPEGRTTRLPPNHFVPAQFYVAETGTPTGETPPLRRLLKASSQDNASAGVSFDLHLAASAKWESERIVHIRLRDMLTNDQFRGRKVLLISPDGTRHNLREMGSTDTIPITLRGGTAELRVLIGDRAFVDQELDVPEEIIFGPIYPNPSRGPVTIEVTLPGTASADVALYDVLGRRVATLHSGDLSRGLNKLQWTGDDLANGVYFLRLESGNHISTQKLVRIR